MKLMWTLSQIDRVVEYTWKVKKTEVGSALTVGKSPRKHSSKWGSRQRCREVYGNWKRPWILEFQEATSSSCSCKN